MFWTRFRTGDQYGVVRNALRENRDRYVFVSGVTLGYTRGSVRRAAEKLLRRFDTDYVDVTPSCTETQTPRETGGFA